MFELFANRTQLVLRAREPLTSGMVNTAAVHFEFSPDWQGMTRRAVFKAGAASRTVLLDEGGQCVIPWEVLTAHGQPLMAGVFGTLDETALPSIWASLGTILEGVPGAGPGTQPPTPDLWEQELARKGDSLYYDGINLSLKSGGKTLSSVQIAGGGGGGTSDHRALVNRDASDQHPIVAISGLREALDSIPIPMTAEQLRKILMNGGVSNG